MEIYTIGFTKKTAAEFFGLLRAAGIRRLVDVRLSNTSQLAGFTKRADLPFLLAELCGADYVYEPLLAPTREIRDQYVMDRDWPRYERQFLALLAERRVQDRLNKGLFEIPAVLLCSEPTPEHCHRRLVLEYLGHHWTALDAVHL